MAGEFSVCGGGGRFLPYIWELSFLLLLLPIHTSTPSFKSVSLTFYSKCFIFGLFLLVYVKLRSLSLKTKFYVRYHLAVKRTFPERN
jgi:hypothetical protein